jgi:hypothetical protein
VPLYPVTVVVEGGEHIARLIDLNLYGRGDTEYEAFAMLSDVRLSGRIV